MDFFNLDVFGIKRKLPIIALTPRIRVASVNLLGDRELVDVLAKGLLKRIKNLQFDYLVGPEVKVVPLLQELSRILGKKRYIVCRKQIHGYMVSPLKIGVKPTLVLDGADAKLIYKKKVIVVDDVVSSGRTMMAVGDLMKKCQAEVVAYAAVFRQEKALIEDLEGLIYLFTLPVFAS